MSKALGGFIVGFFLASLLFSGFVFVKFGPLESDIKDLIPKAESAYETTHSNLYAMASDAVSTLSELASAASIIPGLGGTANAASSGLTAISEIMTTAKDLTEKVLPVLKDMLFLIQISLPTMIISTIMILVGFFVLNQSKSESITEEEHETHKGYRTCLKCGSQWPKNEKFCGDCGEKLGKK
ncbi:MAG: hypothetical protein ACE5DI_03480 [Candidatus Micrarchaeia archaeon]